MEEAIVQDSEQLDQNMNPSLCMDISGENLCSIDIEAIRRKLTPLNPYLLYKSTESLPSLHPDCYWRGSKRIAF